MKDLDQYPAGHHDDILNCQLTVKKFIDINIINLQFVPNDAYRYICISWRLELTLVSFNLILSTSDKCSCCTQDLLNYYLINNNSR